MLGLVAGAPVINKLSKQRSKDSNFKILSCEAEGSPKPTVQWSINGTNVRVNSLTLNLHTQPHSTCSFDFVKDCVSFICIRGFSKVREVSKRLICCREPCKGAHFCSRIPFLGLKLPSVTLECIQRQETHFIKDQMQAYF